MSTSKNLKSIDSKDKLDTLLGPETWIGLVLERKTPISPDTFLFRFTLPSPNHKLGLPVGQNIQVRAKPGSLFGQEGDVIRAYTPVSSNDDKGFMDLLIKVYFKNVHPSFPKGGIISQYIHSLEIGDTLEVRGPTGRLLYYGQGNFATRPDKVSDYSPVSGNKRINMIAGGSGITPMLQIIRAILKDETDLSIIALLFANKSVDDILCREELESIKEKFPHRVKIWFTLDNPPKEGWKYGSGFITDEMHKAQLYPPSETTMTLLCGPPPMITYACNPNLDKLGYSMERRHAY